MAYAIFESGSKQYRVQPGDVIEVERLDGAEADKLTFDDVLFLKRRGRRARRVSRRWTAPGSKRACWSTFADRRSGSLRTERVSGAGVGWGTVRS